MPAKNPRLSTVVDPQVHEWILRKAAREGIPVSMTVRDLLREAFDFHEEAHWARVAEERLATFKRSAAIRHEAFWKGK